ncbi:ATP-binding protein [Streptomyces sp. SLBN-31]|uniref:ATP-binding protein n=1 Tax=Streptomyces sp. SLBN-31 TaxID=2768444 RepID=UPI0011544A44|nr:ATP-binding protein [Streptomyces sp. SLBN-31]TQJ90406.1 SUKH-4 immunity protein of toxin-antitoxin system [Streptomyces sp. SLBN-31]
MELTPEQAIERVEAWLAEPNRLYETLAVRGQSGVGKTRLLLELSARIPQAVYVDCRGMTADDVARHLLSTWGVPDASSLVSGAQHIRGGGVALLANVQWADQFVTSDEASRITQQVTRTLKRLARPSVQFVVERSADRPWVLAPAKNDLVLVSPSGSEEDDGGRVSELARLTELHPALRALAAAELRTISLPVWAGLCRCLGIQVAVDELEELLEILADVLITVDVLDGEENERAAGFTAESDRHRIRRFNEVDHGALLESLLGVLRTHESWSSISTDSFGRYAAQTVALHAFHAGRMEEVLNDGNVLPCLDTTGLLRGMAAAWPQGVPQHRIAVDIHYLEGLGLAAAPHEEWVAWLHHCALSRGEVDLARAMAVRAGNELPWLTMWTECRPFGVFGKFQAPMGGWSEDPTAMAFTSERLLPLLRESHTWHIEKTGPPIRHIFDGRQNAFRPFRSKELSDSQWLVTGPSGPFVIEVSTEPGRQPHLPGLPAPFVSPLTKTGVWNCPSEALEGDAPAQSWLEATFGKGTCRRLPESRLPNDLGHTGSRLFLTTVGFPKLTKQIPFVRTIDLDETGLTAVPWPVESGPAEGIGPFYHLGEWTGGNILLDGDSGAVVQDYSTGYSSVTLATSLQQFCTILRLYHEFLISDFNTPEERRDARHSLREWAEHIDPVTEDADHWEQVFDGDLDSWETR